MNANGSAHPAGSDPACPPEVTAPRLRELVDYDPLTGEFTRHSPRRGPLPRADGVRYRRLTIDGRGYYAHRLAWLYVHGVWPSLHIDHINGDPRDNRIENLRDVPEQMNRENLRRPKANSFLGILGVSQKRNKFAAYIRSGGKTHALGSFNTPEAASAAYLAAKRLLHKGCTL